MNLSILVSISIYWIQIRLLNQIISALEVVSSPMSICLLDGQQDYAEIAEPIHLEPPWRNWVWT